MNFRKGNSLSNEKLHEIMLYCNRSINEIKTTRNNNSYSQMKITLSEM
jgi:hypothetical protein